MGAQKPSASYDLYLNKGARKEIEQWQTEVVFLSRIDDCKSRLRSDPHPNRDNQDVKALKGQTLKGIHEYRFLSENRRIFYDIYEDVHKVGIFKAGTKPHVSGYTNLYKSPRDVDNMTLWT